MEAPNQVQLIVSWVPGSTGVQVSGPIGDKMLVYALLEMAKDAVREYKPSPILAPPLEFPRLPS